jgi:hypothetical protein
MSEEEEEWDDEPIEIPSVHSRFKSEVDDDMILDNINLHQAFQS